MNERTNQIIRATRINFTGYLRTQVLFAIHRLFSNYRNSEDECKRSAAMAIIEDGFLINSFLTTLLEKGSPSEVLFFTESGEQISLKTKEPLSEDSLANLLLDALKTKTWK